MLGVTKIERIFRNPSFGLIPLLVFSILICYINSRIAVSIALLLSLTGLIVVNKRNRLIYDVSTLTFLMALLLSFSTLSELPFLNKFIIVEVIFVILLIFIRLSKGRLLTIVARDRDRNSRNLLKESFRVAFQSQYGLTFHLMLVLLYYATGNREASAVTTTIIISMANVIILGLILVETTRLHLLRQKLYKEEWLPVVTETGQVMGRVAKSVTTDLKNRFMHPVVRVALMSKGEIYLKERDQTRVLNPGKLDYPFEKYMQYNDKIDDTVKKIFRKECGNEDLPIRFMLKYTFENDVTKRLIFLYVSEVNDEDQFKSLNLEGGKLWTAAQIEDNLGADIFSECFELEFEYLKNTLLLAQRFKKTL
ncbi:MAG: hypothetical protein PHV53_02650 [Fermentimonas sp.]|nr:hypothetical protein [Fermentimonas sp.]